MNIVRITYQVSRRWNLSRLRCAQSLVSFSLLSEVTDLFLIGQYLRISKGLQHKKGIEHNLRLLAQIVLNALSGGS